ncbi:MAG: hypothetical protein ABI175_01555 [Polyangiales bacterium]
MKALAALAILAAAGPAHADARMTISNDAFSEVTPPLDDSGFTTDLGVAFWRPWRGDQLGGSLWHRWLTEVGGQRREDLLELFGTFERTWGTPRVLELTTTARLGPAFTGNLGGRWMQNGWHSVTGTGPTLDQGLQHDYIADRAIGMVAGDRTVGSIGVPEAQAYGSIDGQVAVGTGVSWIELAAGGRLIGRIYSTELGAHGEVAIARYSVSDAALALPGGYGEGGWQREWRVGVHVAWRRVMFAYEYRANEGGSGEPIGTFTVTIKQAGTAF